MHPDGQRPPSGKTRTIPKTMQLKVIKTFLKIGRISYIFDRRHEKRVYFNIFQILLKVPGMNNSIVVEGLDPYTVYNVTSVTAENAHGRSLPSYSLLVLTLSHR